MKEKSLKKNAFYSVLKVFLSLVFPLITFPYASRILLPEGIGKVNFANSIVSYFVMLASLGIGTYAVREAVKVRDDKNALTKLFKEIFTINFVFCILSYILFFLTIFFVPNLEPYRALLLICSINIIFSIDWIYSANEEFKYLTVRSFIVQLLSVLYLFLFVHTKEDILKYALFGVLINLGNNVVNYVLVFRYIDIKQKPKLNLKQHIKPVFIFFGITVVTNIYTLFDTTMIGFLSTNEEVGYYTASTKLGHMVLSMLAALTSVLLPRLTQYIQDNNQDSFNELIKKTVNILLLLSVPITFGIFLLSKPLIILLSGSQYLPSVASMKIISPIIIFISFGNLIGGQILPSIGKEKIAFYSYIAGAVTNITTNAFLIPKYGALGASIGTVCAEFIVTLIQTLYIHKMIFNKDYIITLIESITSSIFMGAIIIFLNSHISNIILQLLLSFTSGIVVYSLALLLFRNKYFLFYCNKGISFIKGKLKI